MRFNLEDHPYSSLYLRRSDMLIVGYIARVLFYVGGMGVFGSE